MTSEESTAVYVPRRSDILNDIKDILGRLKAGDDVTPPIINLFGIAGIGKTFVLQQLFDEYKDGYDVLWLGFNLKDEAQSDLTSSEARLDLNRRSWGEVVELLNELLGLHYRIAPQVVFDSQVSQPVDQLGDILLARTPQEGQSRPLLLLLDSLDNLPYWKWLQEQLIKPLLERERTMIVCASQTELYWHFWEIRERCKVYELCGFEPDETEHFLGQYHGELLADTVQRLTGGYPLVLKQFARLLALSVPTQASVDKIREQLEGLPNDARHILEQVGILRRAHVAVMQKLLSTLSGEDWEAPTQHWRLHQVLHKIRAHQYIKPSPDTFERFVPELRQWLRDQLSPEQYLRRCEIIANSYYDIAYKHPKTAADALVEWLFFSTKLLLADSDEEKRAVWEARLTKLLARLRHVAEAEQSVRTSLVRPAGDSQTSIGAKVIAWLYTDGELLQNLAKLDLLPRLHDELQPLLQGEVPIRHELRRASSEVLDELGKRIEAMWVPGMTSFEPVLRKLLEKQKQFDEIDQATFRDILSTTWFSLQERPIRSLNEFIIILNSSGVLLYDRERRVYRFNPVILQLLSIAPPRRSSDDVLVDQSARIAS